MNERASAMPPRMADLLRALVAPGPGEANCEGLSELLCDAATRRAYDAIHGAVPFTGSVSLGSLPADVRALARSRRSDLVGIASALCALAPAGRAALLVPDSFLDGTTQAHRHLRRHLIESGRLQGAIRLAAGCYKPRSAAVILMLGETGAQSLWCYEVSEARELQPAIDASVVGGSASVANVPEVVARWHDRTDSGLLDQPRAAKVFRVPWTEVIAAGFDLAFDRYRPSELVPAQPVPKPHEILAELAGMEAEILQGIRDLAGLLK